MRQRLVVVLALYLLATPFASAQGGAWYVSGSLGTSFDENANNHSSNVSIESSTDPGFDVLGALGREFGNGFRVEGAIGYARVNLNKLNVSYISGFPNLSGHSFNADGSADALSFMANGYYDFGLGGPFKPYVSAGIGGARVAINSASVLGTELVNSGNWVFAYQVGAGVGYDLNRKTTVTLGYRYFATEDPTFIDVTGAGFRSQWQSHNLELGLRYRF